MGTWPFCLAREHGGGSFHFLKAISKIQPSEGVSSRSHLFTGSGDRLRAKNVSCGQQVEKTILMGRIGEWVRDDRDELGRV